LYDPLGPTDLSGIADGDEDLVGLLQGSQALEREELGVSGTDADPDQAAAHASALL
jgi:hypothetical protein